jgi:hypothetical protein
MSHAISQGTVPPVPGLEKEEPELAHEEDIAPEDDGPSDDGGPLADDNGAPEKRPLRDVERE